MSFFFGFGHWVNAQQILPDAYAVPQKLKLMYRKAQKYQLRVHNS